MATILRTTLPEFPPLLLTQGWEINRTDKPKLNAAAYSIRSTFAAMAGMDLHSKSAKKGPDIHVTVRNAFNKLVEAMKTVYPDASVVQYIEYTTLNKLKKIEGRQIHRLGMEVRTACVNDFRPLWVSCLDSSGDPPSGRQWQWVADRVLVMLWRQKTKNKDPLSANEGTYIHCL